MNDLVVEPGRGITGVKGLGVSGESNYGDHYTLYGHARWSSGSYTQKSVSRSISKHGLNEAARQLGFSLYRHRYNSSHKKDVIEEVKNGLERGIRRLAKSGPPMHEDAGVQLAAQSFVVRHLDQEGETDYRFPYLLVHEGEAIGAVTSDGKKVAHVLEEKNYVRRNLQKWQSDIIQSGLEGEGRRVWVRIWAEAHGIPFESCDYEQLLEVFRRDEKVGSILDFLNLYLV